MPHDEPRYKSLSNSPMRVGDRYKRGTRRWSFFEDVKKRKPKEPPSDIGLRKWTVKVQTADPYGGSSTPTYSCNCPDKTKQIEGFPLGVQKNPSTNKYHPRTFGSGLISRYKSLYNRYQRGLRLIDDVTFEDFDGLYYVYTIPSFRNERETRDWTASDAGIGPNDPCKHIYAVKMYRGETIEAPEDVPDVPDVGGVGDL